MNKERLSYLSNLTVTALGAVAVGYLFFKFLFVPLLPFFISWATAFMLRPAVCFISRKTKIPKKIVSVVLTIVSVFLVIGAAVMLSFFALREAWEFFSRIASDGRIIDILSEIGNPIGTIFGGSEAADYLTERIGEALSDGISGLVARLVTALSGIIGRIPGVLFFILVTVIASVYFALDIDRINSFFKELLPSKLSRWIVKLKDGVIQVFKKYVVSYLKIISITFVIILAGLLLLKVRGALLISLLIALLDFLPIIGVGTVLVPWSIAEFLLGNTGMGIALIILLAVHELVRQFAEPKIIGKSIGVHPVISLLLLYIGYYTLGFIGILFVPLIAVFINILFNKDAKKESDG